jgi:hypothetical protein
VITGFSPWAPLTVTAVILIAFGFVVMAAERVQRVIDHRLAPVLSMPRSTIGEVLRRHGLSRLRDLDRASGIPIRYVRERPGELLHLDVKKPGRIPDGGGHRFRPARDADVGGRL